MPFQYNHNQNIAHHEYINLCKQFNVNPVYNSNNNIDPDHMETIKRATNLQPTPSPELINTMYLLVQHETITSQLNQLKTKLAKIEAKLYLIQLHQ